jgi:hypothetical protein
MNPISASVNYFYQLVKNRAGDQIFLEPIRSAQT